MASGRIGNPQTWNRYIYVGNNPLLLTDPTGLSWYYNKNLGEGGTYKWYGDDETVGDGYVSVVGSSGRNGSYVYQSAGGQWISLNMYSKSWKPFDTQADATKNFDGQCAGCQELANSIAETSQTKGKLVAALVAGAVVVGATGGVGLYAGAALLPATVTTLGLTETAAGVGTTAAAAAAANPGRTAQILEGLSQAVQNNYDRFVSKIPANSKDSVSVETLGNGSYRFSATSAGNVPGSSAIYAKTVDAAGKTIGYIKTTIGPNGGIISVKDKLK